jgi:hypothetical protein
VAFCGNFNRVALDFAHFDMFQLLLPGHIPGMHTVKDHLLEPVEIGKIRATKRKLLGKTTVENAFFLNLTRGMNFCGFALCEPSVCW